MVLKGIPLPENTPFTQSLPVATLLVGVSLPSPILQDEEEGKEEQEELGFVDLTESVDEFEVFNQPSSPMSLPKEMDIQRKPQKSLLELIENQPGKGGAWEVYSTQASTSSAEVPFSCSSANPII